MYTTDARVCTALESRRWGGNVVHERVVEGWECTHASLELRLANSMPIIMTYTL
jgi:hypothetical protein